MTGHDLPAEWNWKEIRAETNPKERYFWVLAQSRGFVTRGQRADETGYKQLAEEAAHRYDRIRSLCPEDVMVLEQNIAHWVKRINSV